MRISTLWMAVVLAAGFLLTSCQPAPLTREVNIAKVVTDAVAASDRGDRRLLAVRGYNLTVPGTLLQAKDARDRFGLRVLSEYKEVPKSRIDEERNTVLWAYAERYNRIILSEANAMQFVRR